MTSPTDPSPQTEETELSPLQQNKGIVAVVIGLGLLIVMGIGILLYGIASKMGKDDEVPGPISSNITQQEVSTDVEPSAPQISAFSGTQILSVTPSADRIYLTVRKPGASDAVQVFDLDGTFLFEVAPE